MATIRPETLAKMNRVVELKEEGYSTREACEMAGTDQASFSRWKKYGTTTKTKESNTMAKKRSPEEAQKAVAKMKEAVDGGMSVTEAMKKFKVSAGTWQKYKGGTVPALSRTYTKRQGKPSLADLKTPSIVQIHPQVAGGKTLLIVTEDHDLVNSIIESFR